MKADNQPLASDPAGTAYVLRIASEGGPFWLIATKAHRLKGFLDEPLHLLRDRFTKAYGAPAKWVRYRGCHSTAEAACTLADIQHWDDAPQVRRVPDAAPAEKGGAS